MKAINHACERQESVTMAKQRIHLIHNGSVNCFLVNMYFDDCMHQGVDILYTKLKNA